MTLGPTQRLVLFSLEELGRRECPPTPAEIAEHINRRMNDNHDTASSVHQSLLRLNRKGMVEPLGVAASGARCWAITTKGREALDEDERRPAARPQTEETR